MADCRCSVTCGFLKYDCVFLSHMFFRQSTSIKMFSEAEEMYKYKGFLDAIDFMIEMFCCLSV